MKQQKILLSSFMLLAGTMALSASNVSAQTISPSPAPIDLTCTVTVTKVADNYQLPYKNDGYEMHPQSARFNVGEEFIYSFNMESSDPSRRIYIQRVILSHSAADATPLDVLQIDQPNGQCVYADNKQLVCDLNYSFIESAHTPIYFLMKVTPSDQPTASSMITVDTDVGRANCASFLMLPRTSASPSSTTVATSRPSSSTSTNLPLSSPRPTKPVVGTPPSSSPLPSSRPVTYPVASPDAQAQRELEAMKQDLASLQQQVAEQAQVQQAQQVEQSRLQKVLTDILNTLRRVFPFAFK